MKKNVSMSSIKRDYGETFSIYWHGHEGVVGPESVLFSENTDRNQRDRSMKEA